MQKKFSPSELFCPPSELFHGNTTKAMLLSLDLHRVESYLILGYAYR